MFQLVGMLEIPETDNGNYIESIKFGHECLAGLIIVAFSNYLHVYDHSKLVSDALFIFIFCANYYFYNFYIEIYIIWFCNLAYFY